DLPPVEFVNAAEPPDTWFLSTMAGRLNLPLETRSAIDIEVLVNASPTEWTSRVNTMNLSVLMPALKVFSQVKVSSGSMRFAVLDLTRRRVSFEQDAKAELNWTTLKDALTEANPHLIDVRSLENR